LYRGISNFKKGYQPRTNRVKNENFDLFAGPYSIVGGGETISPNY